jgi:uncharacterized membrane protein
MLAKARIAGNAVHPMLVGFPIALFVATVGLLLAFVGTHDAFYYRAAMIADIAGVCAALAATIPGAIDTVALPKGSRSRNVAVQHGLYAALSMALFALSGALLFHGWTNRTMVVGVYALDATIPLAIGVVGFVALVGSAMMGYALVNTHHIGIKPALVRAERPSREPELDAVLSSLERAPAVKAFATRRQLPVYQPRHITVH